jgi:hypothetical protein
MKLQRLDNCIVFLLLRPKQYQRETLPLYRHPRDIGDPVGSVNRAHDVLMHSGYPARVIDGRSTLCRGEKSFALITDSPHRINNQERQ